MSSTIGTTGLPNADKSTLFNALTRTTALVVNYSFATIEPSVDIASLPDMQLDKLAKLFHSAKVVPATISFADITGTVCGASQGKGLGNQFLVNIREADAICLATRVLAGPDAVHAEDRVDPKDNIETVIAELVLADVQALEKQISCLTKKVTDKKTPKKMLEAAKAALELLEQGKVFSTHGMGPDPAIFHDFGLMTTREFIYVSNTDGVGLADGAMRAELRDFMTPAEAIFFGAKFEAELVELEPEEVREMLEVSGQGETGLDKLARVGFDILGLQTYLTVGEEGMCAWTIRKGRTAPQTAGVTHTDPECGFIRAEIVSYDDPVEYDSLAEAHARGHVRVEGKDYVVADGDVVELRTGLTSKK